MAVKRGDCSFDVLGSGQPHKPVPAGPAGLGIRSDPDGGDRAEGAEEGGQVVLSGKPGQTAYVDGVLVFPHGNPTQHRLRRGRVEPQVPLCLGSSGIASSALP